MTIGERIKNKRIEKDLSQSDLAKLAGYCDKTVISKFEHAGNDISMKQIKRIAKALNVSPAYLMGWETEDGASISEGDLADIYSYRAVLDSLPDEEREKTLEIEKQLVKLTPENRTLILNLLKSLLPDA